QRCRSVSSATLMTIRKSHVENADCPRNDGRPCQARMNASCVTSQASSRSCTTFIASRQAPWRWCSTSGSNAARSPDRHRSTSSASSVAPARRAGAASSLGAATIASTSRARGLHQGAHLRLQRAHPVLDLLRPRELLWRQHRADLERDTRRVLQELLAELTDPVEVRLYVRELQRPGGDDLVGEPVLRLAQLLHERVRLHAALADDLSHAHVLVRRQADAAEQHR